jgi:hypothetical protein
MGGRIRRLDSSDVQSSSTERHRPDQAAQAPNQLLPVHEFQLTLSYPPEV